MAPLTRSLDLLGSAVGYALDSARLVTPQFLPRSTPCAGWDLESLLWHAADSAAVLHQAITTGHADLAPPPGDAAPELDPAGEFRRHAAGLLAACAAGPDERRVIIGDRELTASTTAVAGALEMTVHGWDIAAACGARRPVPLGLAVILLPIAPLFVTPSSRAGLFADPVRLPDSAPPGDRLVAFFGRDPRSLGAPKPGTRPGPARDDSAGSSWSL